MEIKEYFRSIDLNEIDRFIQESQEENLHLEFKTVVYPNYEDKNKDIDKKNYSKSLSGFANSNGGIIIWGIKASKNIKGQDVATKKSPIKELTKFLNFLNKLEGQAITPVLSGIVHEKIEIKEDEGFIKTYVPSSENTPHMANYSEKHYYKRSGDSFYICEHFDIMDMINRKQKPILSVGISEPIINQFFKNKRIEFVIFISNTGNVIAKYPLLKIKLKSPYKVCHYGLDGNGKCGLLRNFIVDKDFTATYSGNSDIILFPGIIHNVDLINAEIPMNKNNYPDITIEYSLLAKDMKEIKNKIVKKSTHNKRYSP